MDLHFSPQGRTRQDPGHGRTPHNVPHTGIHRVPPALQWVGGLGPKTTALRTPSKTTGRLTAKTTGLGTKTPRSLLGAKGRSIAVLLKTSCPAAVPATSTVPTVPTVAAAAVTGGL